MAINDVADNPRTLLLLFVLRGWYNILFPVVPRWQGHLHSG